MENILTNPGLIDIREQIFGYFNCKTLEICHEVFANKYGEDWDLWLERLILVQQIHEFGDTKIRRSRTLKDILPGWNKAVKKFVKKASLFDLNDVKGSLKGLSNRAVRYFPFHYVAVKGHVRLMKLLFYTDLNINKRDVREWHWEDTPFIKACQYGQTEVVNLMVTSSQEFGIDLNAPNIRGWTGFMYACHGGHLDIVKLMVENRIKFGINLDTALTQKIVNERIREVSYEIMRGYSENFSFLQKLKLVRIILEETFSANNEPKG